MVTYKKIIAEPESPDDPDFPLGRKFPANLDSLRETFDRIEDGYRKSKPLFANMLGIGSFLTSEFF